MGVWASGASIVKRVGKRFDSKQRSGADGSALASHIRHRSRRVQSGWSDPTPRERKLSLRRRNHVFPNRAHLPWAHTDPLQSFFWFPTTFRIFNNLGNLLFAQRQTKSAEWEGFCHGFATVVRELSRLAYESPDCAWILVANRIPRQQISNLLTRRSPS
jgi:hypothetical protein